MFDEVCFGGATERVPESCSSFMTRGKVSLKEGGMGLLRLHAWPLCRHVKGVLYCSSMQCMKYSTVPVRAVP